MDAGFTKDTRVGAKAGLRFTSSVDEGLFCGDHLPKNPCPGDFPFPIPIVALLLSLQDIGCGRGRWASWGHPSSPWIAEPRHTRREALFSSDLSGLCVVNSGASAMTPADFGVTTTGLPKPAA